MEGKPTQRRMSVAVAICDIEMELRAMRELCANALLRLDDTRRGCCFRTVRVEPGAVGKQLTGAVMRRVSCRGREGYAAVA